MSDQSIEETFATQNGKVTDSTKPSILVGESTSPLWDLTLTQLLQKQVELNPSRECVVFPESRYRASYSELYETTLGVAKGLRAIGIGNGDRVGILAGNIPAYVELFFAVSHVGGIFVVLNTTYTPHELQSALKHSGLLPRCVDNIHCILTTSRMQSLVLIDLDWKDYNRRNV